MCLCVRSAAELGGTPCLYMLVAAAASASQAISLQGSAAQSKVLFRSGVALCSNFQRVCRFGVLVKMFVTFHHAYIKRYIVR